MGEAEFIDLFSDDSKRLQRDKDLNIDDSWIPKDGHNPYEENDFKRYGAFTAEQPSKNQTADKDYADKNYRSDYAGERSFQTGQQTAEKSARPMRRQKKSSLLKIEDEHIIWISAIFIFFGVFAFLIGHWSGKKSMENIIAQKEMMLSRLELELDEKKAQNQIARSVRDQNSEAIPETENMNETSSPAQSTDNDNIPVEPTLNSEKNVAIPETVAIPPEQQQEVVEPAKKTPVADNSKKSTTRNISTTKPETAKTETKNETPAAQTKKSSESSAKAAVTGTYTIQVSAHTSMEKARAIENSIRELGFRSYLVEAVVNGKTYYRVRVGKFGTKNEVDQALSKIRKSPIGKDSYMIKLN